MTDFIKFLEEESKKMKEEKELGLKQFTYIEESELEKNGFVLPYKNGLSVKALKETKNGEYRVSFNGAEKGKERFLLQFFELNKECGGYYSIGKNLGYHNLSDILKITVKNSNYDSNC